MHDLIIIGAGPAGLTSALYAGRFRLNALVLEKLSPGGQIILSPGIENYPGFPGGIATQELIDRFKKQVDELGVRIVSEEVLEINQAAGSGAPFYSVKTDGNTYETKVVIIASGAAAKRLGVEGEERLIGRGISYCGTCDGPLFKDKEIIVVGAGDRALEDALFLTSYARKVTIVHRRDQLRAAGILQEKARKDAKISFILESVLEKIEGKDKVEAVKIRNVKTGAVSSVSCSGVFIFVGISPNTHFVKNLLQIDETGFIITSHNMSTSQEGVFACGDCCKKNLYQVVTACGEGALAADSAYKYLIGRNW